MPAARQILDLLTRDELLHLVVQREMRRLIKRQLRAAGHAADKVDAVAESLVDLLRRRNAR